MEHFPEAAEGELSRLRASIVNETQLATVASQLELGKLIYLGKGEEQTKGRSKNSILANTYGPFLLPSSEPESAQNFSITVKVKTAFVC